MANSSSGHFNAFQKERLAWLNSGISPPIQAVTASGTYTMGTYETSGTEPKALKVLKSTDPTTGLRTWYYIEARQAAGFDGFLDGNANVLNGVIIHTGSEASGDSSNILDLTPGSGVLNVQDWSDPALIAGQTFTDANAGITVKTEWATATSAGVTVTVAGPTPGSGSTPTVTVSTDRTSYARGQTVSMTATALAGGVPIAKKSITFSITKANGSIMTASATTGTNGTAVYKLRLRKQDPVGTYKVSAGITGGTTASNVANFAVQ
jgi:hypothetical protein